MKLECHTFLYLILRIALDMKRLGALPFVNKKLTGAAGAAGGHSLYR